MKKKIKQLEKQLDDTLNIYHSTLAGWSRSVDEIYQLKNEIRQLKAELLDADEENEKLLNTMKLDKDDYHLLRYYNMMVVNRPASAFLD